MSSFANKKLIDLTLLNQYTSDLDDHINGLQAAMDARVQELEDAVPTTETYTLLAENWEQDEADGHIWYYDLEDDYPSATKQIDMYLNDDTASLLQRDAYVDAIMYGSSSSNIITASGTVPSVDLPVILKVVTIANVESP